MTKVVYNACFGGFSISRNMAQYILERTQDEELRSHIESALSDNYGISSDSIHLYDIKRHNPLLVEAVEKYENECKKGCRNLMIKDIGKATRYHINEYDGVETIIINNEDSYWIKVE